MKTPITDAQTQHASGWDSKRGDYKRLGIMVDANLARRLELDRAALMDALQWLDNWLGHKPMPECSKRITDALAAARANFPEP